MRCLRQAIQISCLTYLIVLKGAEGKTRKKKKRNAYFLEFLAEIPIHTTGYRKLSDK